MSITYVSMGEKIKVPSTTTEMVDDSQETHSKFGALYSERRLCDLCLVVNNEKEFPCHRLVLSASSDVFEAMLCRTSWSESMASRIELVELPECVDKFDNFLRYLYTGKIELNFDSAMATLLLADKYRICDLVDHCLRYMCKHMAHAIRTGHLVLWMHGTELCGCKSTSEKFLDFIVWNFGTIINPAIIDFTLLLRLLQRSDLVVHSEMSLFRYVMWWLNEVKRNIIMDDGVETELLCQLLSFIRFPMMMPAELESLSADYEEYKEVFANRVTQGLSFHTGRIEREELLQDKDTFPLVIPRLYTSKSCPVTLNNIHSLPMFSLSAECQNCPGVLLSQGVITKPQSLKWMTVRVSIRRNDLPLPNNPYAVVRSDLPFPNPPYAVVLAKVGVIVYGTEEGRECVRTVFHATHLFCENSAMLHIDDIIPFASLNQLPANGESPYLTGPDGNILQMQVVIQPIDAFADLATFEALNLPNFTPGVVQAP